MQAGGSAGGLDSEGSDAEILQGVLDTAPLLHLGRKAADGLLEVAGAGQDVPQKGFRRSLHSRRPSDAHIAQGEDQQRSPQPDARPLHPAGGTGSVWTWFHLISSRWNGRAVLFHNYAKGRKVMWAVKFSGFPLTFFSGWHIIKNRQRDVAKFGIALGSGPRGPGFDSRRSDHRQH